MCRTQDLNATWDYGDGPSYEDLQDAINTAYNHLMNLQPHIPQACKPGHELFIDSHVNEAMRILAAVQTRQEPDQGEQATNG